MEFKKERIINLIKKEIMNLIIRGAVRDPRVPNILTITKVTLSKDLHYAHIYFSMLGDDSEKNNAVKGLNSAAGFFQKNIADNLKLRFTPKLEFRYDKNAEEAYKVDDILRKLSEEDKVREDNEENG